MGSWGCSPHCSKPTGGTVAAVAAIPVGWFRHDQGECVLAWGFKREDIRAQTAFVPSCLRAFGIILPYGYPIFTLVGLTQVREKSSGRTAVRPYKTRCFA